MITPLSDITQRQNKVSCHLPEPKEDMSKVGHWRWLYFVRMSPRRGGIAGSPSGFWVVSRPIQGVTGSSFQKVAISHIKPFSSSKDSRLLRLASSRMKARESKTKYGRRTQAQDLKFVSPIDICCGKTHKKEQGVPT